MDQNNVYAQLDDESARFLKQMRAALKHFLIEKERTFLCEEVILTRIAAEYHVSAAALQRYYFSYQELISAAATNPKMYG